MLNGLLVLTGSKNRMSGLVYRLLHAALAEDGLYTKGRGRKDWEAVLEAIRFHTGFRVKVYDGPDVAPALRKLHFKNQIAVCDTESGAHSILLTGKSNGWLEAFDPDWDSVKVKRERPSAYIVQPALRSLSQQARINVLVDEDYFVISGKGRYGQFQMGTVSSRELTVIEKR